MEAANWVLFIFLKLWLCFFRLDPGDMLQRLRGKRLVFIGDSLNRNMWESLVCTLRNYVKDKKKVFEVSGRREFKTEGSYAINFRVSDSILIKRRNFLLVFAIF